jgi:GntR family transcriptional regulator
MVHAVRWHCQHGLATRHGLGQHGSSDREASVSSVEGPAREPKYYTVKRHLLEYIEALRPGASVPTERELATELDTSRTTVRQALGELVAEGRLVRRQGSGTYVADAKITWPLHVASFTEQAIANGLVPSSILLDVSRVRADEDVAERLQLEPGAEVHQLDRLRLANDRPMAVETSFMPATRFPYLGRKIRDGVSLHQVIKDEYGVQLVTGEETIDTAPASPQHAKLLQAEVGFPMLVVRRLSFDRSGVPVELGTSWFRGDRITLTASLNVPKKR